jgi:hypothetical protein
MYIAVPSSRQNPRPPAMRPVTRKSSAHAAQSVSAGLLTPFPPRFRTSAGTCSGMTDVVEENATVDPLALGALGAPAAVAGPHVPPKVVPQAPLGRLRGGLLADALCQGISPA